MTVAIYIYTQNYIIDNTYILLGWGKFLFSLRCRLTSLRQSASIRRVRRDIPPLERLLYKCSSLSWETPPLPNSIFHSCVHDMQHLICWKVGHQGVPHGKLHLHCWCWPTSGRHSFSRLLCFLILADAILSKSLKRDLLQIFLSVTFVFLQNALKKNLQNICCT